MSQAWRNTAIMRLECVAGGPHPAVPVDMRTGACAEWTVASTTGSAAGTVCERYYSAMLMLTRQPMFSMSPLLVRCSDFDRTKSKSCAQISAFQSCHRDSLAS